jgi:hypothetical protein
MSTFLWCAPPFVWPLAYLQTLFEFAEDPLRIFNHIVFNSQPQRILIFLTGALSSRHKFLNSNRCDEVVGHVNLLDPRPLRAKFCKVGCTLIIDFIFIEPQNSEVAAAITNIEHFPELAR